jgi:hypothetical protein
LLVILSLNSVPHRARWPQHKAASHRNASVHECT